LPACLPVWLLGCLAAWLPDLSAFLSAFLCIHSSVRLSAYPPACLSVCLSVYLSACLSVCFSVSVPFYESNSTAALDLALASLERGRSRRSPDGGHAKAGEAEDEDDDEDTAMVGSAGAAVLPGGQRHFVANLAVDDTMHGQ
jgi:hypothetical protein